MAGVEAQYTGSSRDEPSITTSSVQSPRPAPQVHAKSQLEDAATICPPRRGAISMKHAWQ
jgi:hypothetical protein